MSGEAKNNNETLLYQEQNIITRRRPSRLDWSFLEKSYLYGRQQECQQLTEAFHRRISQNSASQQRCEFILVSGGSGTGKTALAKILQKIVCGKNGFFAMGKFDQLQLRAPEPYAPFVAVFSEFVEHALSIGHDHVLELKDTIQKAVGADACLLTDMIPGLQKILGSSFGPSKLRGAEAHIRLKITVRNFARAICSRERPFVVLLDDLHWADPGSLELLEVLVSDKQNTGIVMVGVCRSNEVSFDHHFSRMLRNLEDNKDTIITNIQVKNLTREAINFLVSDALNHPEELCTQISKTIHAKTQGNVFFVIQLLQSLSSDRALFFDGKTREWILDDKSCNNLHDQDVDALLSRKIKQLPKHTQLVLTLAACIGADFDEYLIAKILERNDVYEILTTTVEAGLVVEGKQFGQYCFSHHRVQQAVYSLLPEDQQKSAHLSIGQSLKEMLSEEEIATHIFLIVDQISRGAELIKNDIDRHDLAYLCLQAGIKATASGDFKIAAIHFWFGISLLRKQRHFWMDQYELSLELYNGVAEAEYCSGNFDQMEMAVEEVLSHARCFTDKIRAYSTRVYSLGGRLRMQEAIDLGIFVLNRLGETFPSRLHKGVLMIDILKTKMLLRSKTDSEILSIPDIDDVEKTAAMGILNLLTVYTFQGKPELFPFMAARMVKLSTQFGLCAISAVGFAMFAIVCCVSGDFEGGNRCGELAIKTLKKYEAGNDWLPRVFFLVHGFTFVWKQPIMSTLGPLALAHQTGIETGDIEISMAAANFYCLHSFIAGTPLPGLEVQARSKLELMEAFGQNVFVATISLQIQMMHNFMGRSDDPLVLTGEVINQDEYFSMATEKKFVALTFNIMTWRLLLAYYFGKYDLALELAEKCRVLSKTKRCSFLVCLQCFYDGMSALAVAQQKSKKRRRSSTISDLKALNTSIADLKLYSIAKSSLKKMKKLASLCPQNCMNKVLLMEAEFAVLRGEMDHAMRKYNKSIELADTDGFLHEKALACERAGWALRQMADRDDLSKPYFERAIRLYRQWGAHAKILQLERLLLS